MDVQEKIVKALNQRLEDAYVQLEDDDGISGFVVSPQFTGVSTLGRQDVIEHALSEAPVPLTTDERRQVLIIAGLTPAEFAAVGTRIRIHRVKETPGGAVEVLLHGGPTDAEYVRRALAHQKGVRTTQPKQSRGAPGVLMSFRAKGTTTAPLTKQKVVRVLKSDPCIEVVPAA